MKSARVYQEGSNMKRAALGTLWGALVAQAVWIGLRLRGGGSIRSVMYVIFVSAVFILLAATQGRIRWIAATLRLFIGFSFVVPVCDRLGFLGRPGSPGVAWGDFHHFILYTGQVNSSLPSSLIPALATLETVIEGLLGIAMLFGWRTRITVWGSTLLLFAFFAAMTVSLGFASQFPYGVLVMATGGWLLAESDSSLFSLDRVFGWFAKRKSATG